MDELRIERRTVLTVPHYLSLLTLIPNTELFAVIPTDLVEAFRVQSDIGVYPLPFSSPRVEIKQIWHERLHHDAANKWLREVVREALKNDD